MLRGAVATTATPRGLSVRPRQQRAVTDFRGKLRGRGAVLAAEVLARNAASGFLPRQLWRVHASTTHGTRARGFDDTCGVGISI